MLTYPETRYKHANEARNILILNPENEILSQLQSVKRFSQINE